MKFGSKVIAVMFVMLSSFLLITHSRAEEKPDQVTIVSHVDVIPDAYLPKAEEAAARLFRAEIAATKQDAGLISYIVLQQIGGSNHFTIVETWSDAKAYEMHAASRHTVKFRTDIQPFLGSPFDSRSHHPFH